MASYTLAEARLRCAKSNFVPYLYMGIANLVPVEAHGLGTFAVDEHMRMYWDPACLEKWPRDETAQTLCHEYLHVFLKHFARSRALVGIACTPQQQQWLNIAADLVVNQVMQSVWNLPADRWLLPAKFGWPMSLTFEEYYRLCEQHQVRTPEIGSSPQQKQPQKGTSSTQQRPGGSGGQDQQPGQGAGTPGWGGASGAADGQPHPWEGPTPEQGGAGMTAHERDVVIRQVAERIEQRRKEQQAKSQGLMSQYLLAHVEALLRPKVNPFAELQAAVRYASLVTTGYGDFTYRKLPRRNPPGACRLPASVKPIPRVTVAVDTSGSMNEQDLAQALGVIALGLHHVPSSGLRVMSGDTEAKSVQRVFSHRKVELLGGGGTDMAKLLQQAADDLPRPDAVVLVTDGYTGWPSHELGPKVVACITAAGRTEGIPNWIRTIKLER